MHDEERHAINAMTTLRGEEPRDFGGFKLRPVSVESLSILSMIGSPFARAVTDSLLGGGDREPAPVSLADVVLFAWVHAADPDEVLRLALGCRVGVSDVVTESALRWSRGLKMEDLVAAVKSLTEDQAAIRAASFEPVDSARKKKEQ